MWLFLYVFDSEVHLYLYLLHYVNRTAGIAPATTTADAAANAATNAAILMLHTLLLLLLLLLWPLLAYYCYWYDYC